MLVGKEMWWPRYWENDGEGAHGDVQQSEIGLIGTSCLLVTYLLNWRAEKWEGEYKRGDLVMEACVWEPEAGSERALHSWSQSTSSSA